MDEGTITEWLVHPGDIVHRGDIVAVVDTDKADVDVEIFEDGVIQELLVPAGERVAVGTPLATVAPDAEPVPEAVPAPAREVPAPVRVTAGPGTASPVVRRLAGHLGVDLATVTGTGAGGTITRSDVEHAAASAEPAEPAQPTEPAPDRDQALRDAIGRLMARSKREIPHYYLGTEVDFSRASAWLEQRNAERPVTERLLAAAVQLKSVAEAALQFPEMNGYWVDEHFVAAQEVHVGVAVALRGGGLIAPALHDVHEKDLDTVMHELRDLVARARAGRLRSSELSDATITVTNLGERGVQIVYGVIYPPQVALVGFGKILDRPWADDGMLGVRPIVSVTLSADHRASDGARGAAFLERIEQLLQDPSEW